MPNNMYMSILSLLLLLVSSGHATAGVVVNSELRVTGYGNNLVMPDGSVQSSAQVAGPQGEQGPSGPAGPANMLTIGTVTNGPAAATITGTAPNQLLNLTLPQSSTAPFSNIVSNTCTYADLKPTEDGFCFCPAAPAGYKAIAFRGYVDCNRVMDTSKYRIELASVQALGTKQQFFTNAWGGWCHYLSQNDDTLSLFVTEDDCPQEVTVECIYVPL